MEAFIDFMGYVAIREFSVYTTDDVEGKLAFKAEMYVRNPEMWVSVGPDTI